MGVITIKVPQQIRRTYQIASETKAKQLIESLDGIATTRKVRDLGEILGLWSDRPDSAEDIARELRRKSNLKRSDG